MPINAHTRSNSALASSLKPHGRGMRPSTCSAGSGSLGPVSIRRAVERPIPDGGHHPIQNLALVRLGCLAVLGAQLVRYLSSRGHVDLAFHIGQAFRVTRSK
jgi:hypothetical protein